MDEAIWWTEYVVRNRGAPHLRPLGADLAWYEYLLLDVVVCALAAVVLAVALFKKLLAVLLRTSTPGRGDSRKKNE